MDVRVMLEPLSPGMQDCEETDPRSQPFRIRCHFQQGLSNGAKQDCVNGARVL
jgi:hypothetical protein